MGPQTEFLETVITCKGNYYSPDFLTQFSNFKFRLQKLVVPDNGKDLLVEKIEPWNSVRVTLKLPLEAANKLKYLAEQQNYLLKEMGVLAVQIGKQQFSLNHARPSQHVPFNASMLPNVPTNSLLNSSSLASPLFSSTVSLQNYNSSIYNNSVSVHLSTAISSSLNSLPVSLMHLSSQTIQKLSTSYQPISKTKGDIQTTNFHKSSDLNKELINNNNASSENSPTYSKFQGLSFNNFSSKNIFSNNNLSSNITENIPTTSNQSFASSSPLLVNLLRSPGSRNTNNPQNHEYGDNPNDFCKQLKRKCSQSKKSKRLRSNFYTSSSFITTQKVFSSSITNFEQNNYQNEATEFHNTNLKDNFEDMSEKYKKKQVESTNLFNLSISNLTSLSSTHITTSHQHNHSYASQTVDNIPLSDGDMSVQIKNSLNNNYSSQNSETQQSTFFKNVIVPTPSETYSLMHTSKFTASLPSKPQADSTHLKNDITPIMDGNQNIKDVESSKFFESKYIFKNSEGSNYSLGEKPLVNESNVKNQANSLGSNNIHNKKNLNKHIKGYNHDIINNEFSNDNCKSNMTHFPTSVSISYKKSGDKNSNQLVSPEEAARCSSNESVNSESTKYSPKNCQPIIPSNDLHNKDDHTQQLSAFITDSLSSKINVSFHNSPSHSQSLNASSSQGTDLMEGVLSNQVKPPKRSLKNNEESHISFKSKTNLTVAQLLEQVEIAKNSIPNSNYSQINSQKSEDPAKCFAETCKTYTRSLSTSQMTQFKTRSNQEAKSQVDVPMPITSPGYPHNLTESVQKAMGVVDFQHSPLNSPEVSVNKVHNIPSSTKQWPTNLPSKTLNNENLNELSVLTESHKNERMKLYTEEDFQEMVQKASEHNNTASTNSNNSTISVVEPDIQFCLNADDESHLDSIIALKDYDDIEKLAEALASNINDGNLDEMLMNEDFFTDELHQMSFKNNPRYSQNSLQVSNHAFTSKENCMNSMQNDFENKIDKMAKENEEKHLKSPFKNGNHVSKIGAEKIEKKDAGDKEEVKKMKKRGVRRESTSSVDLLNGPSPSRMSTRSSNKTKKFLSGALTSESNTSFNSGEMLKEASAPRRSTRTIKKTEIALESSVTKTSDRQKKIVRDQTPRDSATDGKNKQKTVSLTNKIDSKSSKSKCFINKKVQNKQIQNSEDTEQYRKNEKKLDGNVNENTSEPINTSEISTPTKKQKI